MCEDERWRRPALQEKLRAFPIELIEKILMHMHRTDRLSLSALKFFNSFAVNMWLQYRRRGRWADPLFAEKAYIVLSLLAKSALAWQVYGGALAGG